MREFNDIVQKIFTNFPEEFNGPFGSDKQTYRAFYELRDWINNTICNDKPNNYVKVCLESLRLYNKTCNIFFYYDNTKI